MQILIFIPFAISIMRKQTQTSVAGRKSALLLDFGTFPRIYSSLHRCGSKSFFFNVAQIALPPSNRGGFNILKANVSTTSASSRKNPLDFLVFILFLFFLSFSLYLLGFSSAPVKKSQFCVETSQKERLFVNTLLSKRLRIYVNSYRVRSPIIQYLVRDKNEAM